MKRTYTIVLILCLLMTSFAFADSREITASNFRECLSIINEVDPVETTQVVLEDGTEYIYNAYLGEQMNKMN